MTRATTARWQSYDDIEVGATIQGFGRTLTEGEIVMISAMTSGLHQPLHVDAEWMRENTKFPGLILPGPLIITYAIGLLSATLVYSTITLAFLGLDKVRAKAPVLAGDTIRPRATVVSKRLTSNGESGVIELDIEVLKQDGTAVMTFLYTLMVRAKPVA